MPKKTAKISLHSSIFDIKWPEDLKSKLKSKSPRYLETLWDIYNLDVSGNTGGWLGKTFKNLTEKDRAKINKTLVKNGLPDLKKAPKMVRENARNIENAILGDMP